MNDTRFSKSLDAARGHASDAPSISRRIRLFFSRRSFIYSKLREAKFKFQTFRGVQAISPDGITIAGHGINNPSLNNPVKAMKLHFGRI